MEEMCFPLKSLSIRCWILRFSYALLLLKFGWDLLIWIEAFRWFAVVGKILTADIFKKESFLRRPFWSETIDHILLHFDFVFSAWGHFLEEWGMAWCFPSSLASLVDTWGMRPFTGCGFILWRSIPFSVLFGKKRMGGYLKGRCAFYWGIDFCCGVDDS